MIKIIKLYYNNININIKNMFIIEIKGLSNHNRILFFNFLNINKHKLQGELIKAPNFKIIFKCSSIINNFIKYINDSCINMKINDSLEFIVKYYNNDLESVSSFDSSLSLNSVDTINDNLNIEDFF